MKNKFKVIVTSLLLGTMVACGGGGGTSTDNNSVNSTNPPVSENISSEDKVSDEVVSSDDIVSSEAASQEQPSENNSQSEEVKEFEEVSYSVNISDLETGTQETDTIVNRFTIPAGTEIRNRTKTYNGADGTSITFEKSVKIGSSSASIIVDSPGKGTLSFYIQNGSSGAATQFVVIDGPNGSQEIEFAGTNESSPVVKLEIEVEEGIYTIKRKSGTIDIYQLDLVCMVEKAEESGFEIAAKGKIDYIEGEAFDSSDLQLNKVFGNGRTDTLDINDANVKVDSSKFNSAVPGVYPITVSYKEYAPITYDVTVYGVNELTLGFDAIEKIANSSAGNGVYFNHSVREVYNVGDTFDAKGLSVIANGAFGEAEKDFLLDDYQVTGFDSESAGTKTVTVSFETNGKTVSETFDVYVVAEAPCKNGDVFQVKVDQEYTGVIGSAENGFNMFTTVQQALDYLGNHESITNNDKKLLYVAEGTYTEKLEITIPYLTIQGENTDTTVIEWDSIYGLNDAGGFTHTTDSTATVAIRESAFRCVIDGVTISNWYNSQARMDERNLGIERALALLVQSDQFVMRNGKLLGIQDTLELFTGRQYFENTFISGYTDFIFGTNNTTYFTDCTIHTIDTTKDDSGTAGYLTAFKGSNKGSGDAVTYGAIFDDCDFTADEGVMKGKTAIGRPWGAYAAVAVINSRLGDHISTDGYNSSSNKNTRYVAMNAKPTDETVQYVEYNNTGAGAIQEAVAGMRMLTAEEAANYSNFEIIFGTTNNKVTYNEAWDPMSTDVVVDDSIYYIFNNKPSVTGVSYVYDQNIQGGTGTFGDIAIDATSGKVTARDSDTQINQGAKMTFNVKAGTTVTVNTYPGYHAYTLNGVATSSDTFAQHYAEDTTVVFEAVGQVYLFSIVINPNEEAPEAAVATSLSISGQKTSFVAGEEFDYSTLKVQVNYSDNSLVTLEADQYEVTLNGDTSVSGNYVATVSYNGLSTTYDVTYVAAGVDPTVIAEDTTIQFGEEGNYKTSPYIVDADSCNFRDNSGNNCQITGSFSIKVKAGATVAVSSYSGYTSYTVSINGGEASAEQTGTEYTFTVSEDSTITFSSVKNDNYFYNISVTY